MSDIFTGTPAGLTYDHEVVRQAWMAVWIVASGALVVIVGWMGLSLIVGDHVGRAQAGWRELVPRLLLGLVAAAASLWWCALVIDIADAVSGFIAAELGVTAGDMLRSTLKTLLRAVSAGSVGMALLLALVYLVYGFFVLYLVVQMVLRLALIDILLALAPIALGLWILPHTAGWGRHWLRLFMTTVFQQAVQLVALALGIGFLNEYAAIGGTDAMQDLVWKLLMSLAFIYLATRVPSLLGNAGTFDAWLHTLYFGLSLPGSM
ncbi:MAG: type IV secretion system protein, partial [Chloroflexi bacterium]|nr:type IV secretion system protein [Chloroflexota bacterium]